ncbi:MAG: hypothetical protein A2Z14_05235 [Chloroflexi bacterium RBG_16_48_8]|nr:MAG: hypothetical protein A2Z14_05235 [Chloroflexi bacterium RBG_16_48_8]
MSAGNSLTLVQALGMDEGNRRKPAAGCRDNSLTLQQELDLYDRLNEYASGKFKKGKLALGAEL